MKKLALLLGIVFGITFTFAQDTNKIEVDVPGVHINIDLDEILRSVEESVIKMEELVSEKQAEVDKWNDQIYVYSENEDENEERIDSLDHLVEINEEVIEELNEAIEELIEEMDELEIELAEGLEELENINIDIDMDDFDDFEFSKKKKKKFKGHWAGMSLGINTFVTNDYSFSLPAESDYMSTVINKSLEYSFNPVQFSIPFFNRYVGAVTGLGMTFNNYELVQNIKLDVDANGDMIYIPSDVAYDKNKFKTFNLTAPLLLEFQIPVNKKDKRIFLAAGVIGSMNLTGKMKVVYNDGNSKIKYKDKSSNWPLTTFSYHGTARVGYNDWYLFANYSFLPLFEETKGAEVYPVTAGVGFRF